MKYKNFSHCLKETWTKEGYAGLFSGYIAYVPRTFLSSALLFTVYERTYKYLKS
jgi:hypothetical protein